MKLTYKAIARAAGYYAWNTTPGKMVGKWEWKDQKEWSDESCFRTFATEEEAYVDCCIKCGLVETEGN
jgi:hypothetical protein